MEEVGTATGDVQASAGLLTPAWRKSSYSNGEGACVEVAQLGDELVLVRDSKVADGPVLRFPSAVAAAFTRAAAMGHLSR
ncbi:hypothetical protein GCM10012285_24090 [Streptomyces kronopolitis]|uniref:DUF397 domain-containing protein n=2 Tax=Streptomyces kronopolitis TaxID=1612435 RepID=A0ABQ2JCM2_9ACTN|nr:hypothetical protein GCM10012285_24090 [Streptomyces kronopolitis]